jgi:hypothetical protein
VSACGGGGIFAGANGARSMTARGILLQAVQVLTVLLPAPLIQFEERVQRTQGQLYFSRRLVRTQDVAPIFGPCFFAPLESLVNAIAKRLRITQSGDLNVYLEFIGVLLVGSPFVALL